MFGHNDDGQLQPPANIDGNDDTSSAPTVPSITPIGPPEDPAPAASSPDWQHPGQPLTEPAISADSPAPTPVQSTASDNAAGTSQDLHSLKQQALGQLSPLVGHLDQTPEEKFRTLMMMIQASDDQSLLQEAYDAAQQITDEKTKAQALLDVVNEINYFTHHKD
jgi:hypothetical protein